MLDEDLRGAPRWGCPPELPSPDGAQLSFVDPTWNHISRRDSKVANLCQLLEVASSCYNLASKRQSGVVVKDAEYLGSNPSFATYCLCKTS